VQFKANFHQAFRLLIENKQGGQDRKNKKAKLNEVSPQGARLFNFLVTDLIKRFAYGAQNLNRPDLFQTILIKLAQVRQR